jgi:hypothetical protein
MKTNRHFIFYTAEGFTFQPDSENDTPEVDNCQVLGWGRGDSAQEAYENFKKENTWLEKLHFNFLIGAELQDEKTYHFNLKT